MLLKTPYIPEFTGDINPLNLHYISLVGKKVSKSPRENFTYLELGCGQGVSLNILAASYPHGSFYGIDGLESHIQNARQLQENSQLTNVEFIHSLFDAVKLDSLPTFDFIVTHGVWSHIDYHSHQHILNIIKQKLNPGGLVYVSYDTLPGYGVAHMMREMIVRTIEDNPEDPISCIQQGLGYLQFMRQQNSFFFQQNPTASTILDYWLTQPLEYLVHQILPPASRPYFFHEVNAAFSKIGVEYLGTSPLVWNFLAPTVPPPQARQLIRQFPEQPQIESQKDFFNNQSFRRDIFRRPLPEEPNNIDDLLDNCYFGSLVLTSQVAWQKSNVFGMRFQYPQAEFNYIVQQLSQGSATLPSLTQGDTSQREPLLRQLNSLIFGEQFAVFTEKTTLAAIPNAQFRVSIPLLFNQNQIYTPNLMGSDGIFVASPVLGNGVRIPTSDALIIRALAEGTTPDAVPARCWDLLSATGVSIVVNGQKLMTAESHVAEFTRRLQSFINERLCKYAELKLITIEP
jgi:SAM-dependent methyltransferase